MLFALLIIIFIGLSAYCWVGADRALAVGSKNSAVGYGALYAVAAAFATLALA